MTKKRLIFLLVPLVIVCAIAAVVVVYFVTQRVSYDSKITTPGLTGKIVIHRGEKGIPSIKAQSREDICFALGYLHAQDRFALLEYFRTITSGSVDTIIGPDGVILKRLVTAAGIRSTADAIAGELTSPHKEMLQSYARGINLIRHQWFQKLHGTISQRDWNMRDVIAVLVLRDWVHAFLQNRELLFPVPLKKNKWKLQEIIPGQLIATYSEAEETPLRQLEKIRDILHRYIGPFNRGFAFSLPPYRNKKGLTRTALSLKSNMNIYPGWYPVHIVLGDIRIFGVTHAGLPFIYFGNNQNISFCGFNLNVDTQTFHTEQTRDFKGILRYLDTRGWQEFKSVKEPYFDSTKSHRHDVVWHSSNGPIMNAITGSSTENEITFSMKFISPDAGYIVSLLEIPFSENIEKAVQKVKGVTSLPRVYLFSGSRKTIKIFSGRMPLINPARPLFRRGTMNGWRGTMDLSAYQVRGFRQVIAGSSFMKDAPFALTLHGNNEKDRHQRLVSLLTKHKGVMPRSFIKKILQDIHSSRAERFLPHFIKMLQPNPVTSARLTRIYFKEWDFTADKNSVAPAIFERLMYNYITETVSDELPFLNRNIRRNYHLLEDNFYRMVTAKGSMFFDDTATENIESREFIFDRAFLKSMRWLNRQRGPIMNDWTWGSIHKGHYRIPIEEKTLASRYIYEISDRAISGTYGTIYNDSAGHSLVPGNNTSLLGVLDNEKIHAAADFSCSVNPMSQFYYGREQSPEFRDITIPKSRYKTVISPLP